MPHDDVPIAARLRISAVPFAVSLLLSALTQGAHPQWQDSGFFLVAVKDLGVLYPTGFALYLLLCKAWTLVLFFVDFTLAVNLFSSLCAALAAGALSQAARELLTTRGPLFRVAPQEPGPGVDAAAMAAGCLAAAGYSFWSAALLAKVYAFYYLILALLIWRMIRADASGSGRDLTIVAALIGLAWQAHPSATTTGLALLLFVGFHGRTLGVRGLAGRIGVAAACALGPVLLLPIFAAREPALLMGDPRSLHGLWDYLTGSRFTQVSGVFGISASRVQSVAQFFWEEFLGVGVLLVTLGLVQLARSNRRLLLGLAAWVVPVLVVTVLFRMEGQHEFWFVAAWIPLWLAAAVGLHALGSRAGARAEGLIAGLALAGLLWAFVLNRPLLDNRNQTLPESLGHLYLDNLDEGAVLVLRSDNPVATTLYLQQIQGVRRDVTIVSASSLTFEGYEKALQRRAPFLATPDYAGFRERFPTQPRKMTVLAAFADANGGRPDHPIFFEVPPPGALIRPDRVLVAAGPMFKLVPKTEERLDPKYWRAPVQAEDVALLQRRERAQFNEYLADSVRVRPESYEHRFLRDLLRSRKNLADGLARSGTAEGFRRSVEIYEGILALDPWMRDDAGAVYPLAGAYFGLKRYDLAEPWLKRALELELPPNARAQACQFLSMLCRDTNRAEEAARWQARSAEALQGPPAPRRSSEEPDADR